MLRAIRRIAANLLRQQLPQSVPRTAFDIAWRLMSPATRDSSAIAYEMVSMEASLRRLSNAGFNPARIIDIGACAGQWTRMIKGIFPEAAVLMLEARQSELQCLADTCAEYDGTVSFDIALLGSRKQVAVDFHVTAGGTGSSVYAEDSDVVRRSVQLEMVTLDEILVRRSMTNPDFMKLDVQGYELEILRGGADALRGTQVVLMEAALWPYNRGAPLLSEVLEFMSGHGFRLYDICSMIRRPQDGALLQTDLLFVREQSPLLAARTTRWTAGEGD